MPYHKQCKKRKFSTKRFAKKAIKKSKKVKYRKYTLNETYFCQSCQSWHVTKLSNKQYQSKVADYKLMQFLTNDLKGDL